MTSLVLYPHSHLRKVCDPVTVIDDKTRDDAMTLLSALDELDSPLRMVTGLASNQIGLSSRMVALRTYRKGQVVMINPELERSILPSLSIELCASVPGKVRLKKRYMFTTIRYLDLENNTRTMNLFGSASFIMQQELDHLDGKLIID